MRSCGPRTQSITTYPIWYKKLLFTPLHKDMPEVLKMALLSRYKTTGSVLLGAVHHHCRNGPTHTMNWNNEIVRLWYRNGADSILSPMTTKISLLAYILLELRTWKPFAIFDVCFEFQTSTITTEPPSWHHSNHKTIFVFKETVEIRCAFKVLSAFWIYLSFVVYKSGLWARCFCSFLCGGTFLVEKLQSRGYVYYTINYTWIWIYHVDKSVFKCCLFVFYKSMK